MQREKGRVIYIFLGKNLTFLVFVTHPFSWWTDFQVTHSRKNRDRDKHPDVNDWRRWRSVDNSLLLWNILWRRQKFLKLFIMNWSISNDLPSVFIVNEKDFFPLVSFKNTQQRKSKITIYIILPQDLLNILSLLSLKISIRRQKMREGLREVE